MKYTFLAFLLALGTLYAQTGRFEYSTACFNTSYDEFGVRMLNGKMYVISASLDEDKQVILDEEAQKPFTDIYEIEGCALTDAFLKNSESQELWLISSRHNDGAFTSNRYQSRVYFSHNNSDEIAYNMGLYYLNRSENGWSNSYSFPLNSEQYNIVHPYFDEESKSLFFSSNMPGGLGGYDIYKVNVTPNGFSPVQQVSNVNSKNDDFHPHLKGGRFYFSSNREGGLGGLDVYCLDELNQIENLSINSSFDDFDLYFTNDQTGFFSSNRSSNGQHDDVYFFTFTKAEQYYVERQVLIDSTLLYKSNRSEVLTGLLDNLSESNILLSLASSSMKSLVDSSTNQQEELALRTAETYAQLTAFLDTLNHQVVADAGADYNLKMKALDEINNAIEALKNSNNPTEQEELLRLIEQNLNLVNPNLVAQNNALIEGLKQQLAIRNQLFNTQQSYSKQLTESSMLAFSEVLSLENTPENQQLKSDFSNYIFQTLLLDATAQLRDSLVSLEKLQQELQTEMKQQISNYLQFTTNADPNVLEKLDSLLSLLDKELSPEEKNEVLQQMTGLLNTADPKLSAQLTPFIKSYENNLSSIDNVSKEFEIVSAKFSNEFRQEFIQLSLEASGLSKAEFEQRIALMQGSVGIDLTKVFDPEAPNLSPELLATFLANHQPENILFNFDSYALSNSYHQMLDDLVRFALKYKQFKIFLDGHTDITGRASYNLRLSQKRANSVRVYLESKGLDNSNFVISSFGFDKPIATNKTKEGRRLNRRVEIKLVTVQ